MKSYQGQGEGRKVQPTDAATLIGRCFRAIEEPGSEDPAALVHPRYRNHSAAGEAAALRGSEAFAATVDNLNRVYTGLRFEVLDLVTQGDRVATRTVLRGAEDGRPFEHEQSHWFRLADGRLAEHWGR
jgi:ketosteroid isomerase-like protein